MARYEVYKDYSAPIIRRVDGADRADVATFGIVPRKHIPQGVRVFDTMNARRNGGRKTLVQWGMEAAAAMPHPGCEAFYEPDYETGKAVRWRIGMADGSPFAIAGLWREWG